MKFIVVIDDDEIDCKVANENDRMKRIYPGEAHAPTSADFLVEEALEEGGFTTATVKKL
jgi:hypothetical protein